jgi:hypothetical protein
MDLASATYHEESKKAKYLSQGLSAGYAPTPAWIPGN